MDTLFVALRVIVSLGVVVGLLWMVQRRVSKGSKRVRSTKLVQVVSRQGIAQKASVVVVDMEGQRFLLGVTEHSVTVLSTGDAPVAEAAAVREAEPVPEVLEGTAGSGVVPSRASGTGGASGNGAPSRASGTGGASGSGFAAALAAAKKNALPAAVPGFDPRTGQPRRGALDGSIVSPATWRRAATALRGPK